MHLIFRHVFNALSTVHMAAAAARVEDGLHGCIAYKAMFSSHQNSNFGTPLHQICGICMEY